VNPGYPWAMTMGRQGGERNPAEAEEVSQLASLKNLSSLTSNHTVMI
jgi:hypothetical protein